MLKERSRESELPLSSLEPGASRYLLETGSPQEALCCAKVQGCLEENIGVTEQQAELDSFGFFFFPRDNHFYLKEQFTNGLFCLVYLAVIFSNTKKGRVLLQENH